jgi:small subunit ribosomal protein S4
MSRYRGPKVRITRRLGDLVALTVKTSYKEANCPGQHRVTRLKRKLTLYAKRLEEKQKLKFNYGLTEKRLKSYVKQSRNVTCINNLLRTHDADESQFDSKKKLKYPAYPGDALLKLIEMRLDNIIFRIGMAPTIASARQVVTHRHITVNGLRSSIPSYQCQPGDILGVRANSVSISLVKKNLTNVTMENIPPNIHFDSETLTCKILAVTDRKWVALKLEEMLIVEHYSRLR